MKTEYFVSKMFDDVIFRYNEEANELEIYNGKDNWVLRPGMYADYLTGVHSSVWSITEEEAMKVKNYLDNLYYEFFSYI